MKEFQKVIEEMIALFRKFTGIEQVKLQAVRENHVATVEECMTKEQALILSLRGLEKRRVESQQKAGYDGMTFHQILESVSQGEREELLPLFDELSRQVQMFQEVNEDANQILKTNLHVVNREIARRQSGIYGVNGKNKTQEQHMTSRKV